MKSSWVFWLGILLLSAGSWIIAVAFGTERVEVGDTVSLHYSLNLADGTVYFSSIGGEPLRYTLGKGNLLPGFEAALIGMRIGDSKAFKLTSAEAYGPYQPALVMEVERNRLPQGSEPVVGRQLQTTGQSGNPLMMTITEVRETSVILDANHPLAGQDLTFDVKLMAIGNNTTPASSMQTTLKLAIIALSAAVVGLIFFGRRNRRHSIIRGKPASVGQRHF